MEFTVLKTKISVSPFFFAVLTVFLLADKNGIGSFAVLFSLIHETAHFLALLCIKSFPLKIKISVFGINMELPFGLSTAKKCFVLAFGFITNFAAAIVMFSLDKNMLGYINLFIGGFTALPLASTDGGSILRALFEEFMPEKAGSLFRICSLACCSAISILLIILVIFSENYFILIALIYMILCAIKTAA